MDTKFIVLQIPKYNENKYTLGFDFIDTYKLTHIISEFSPPKFDDTPNKYDDEQKPQYDGQNGLQEQSRPRRGAHR